MCVLPTQCIAVFVFGPVGFAVELHGFVLRWVPCFCAE
jgi:hypothetical protein